MHRDLVRYRNKLLNRIKKADLYFEILGREKIFVAGISGGFDSLVMLDLLYYFKIKHNRDFDVHAVFVDNSFKTLINEETLREFIEGRGFSFVKINDTESKEIIEKRSKPFRPCFICSRVRRKLLVEYADKLKAKRILLGHTLDDVIETLFLNMFYSRGISTILPLQALFQGKFFISRPLILIEKSEILTYAKLMGISDKFEGKCIFENDNKRETVRRILQELYRIDPQIKRNLKHALFGYNEKFMWTPFKSIKSKLLDN
ncbi:MAG: ATP-binding protein [candidate division WOR-3 bacterium]